jgi:hypothetical protein
MERHKNMPRFYFSDASTRPGFAPARDHVDKITLADPVVLRIRG